LEQNLYKGWNARRSGEVMLLTAPSWMESSKKGTTHGSSYSYDTRVPLIFYGNGIKKGKSINPVSITDIAPTLAHLMKVQYPNGCTGKALNIFRD
jgi:arylsulfatase A-like enzyme